MNPITGTFPKWILLACSWFVFSGYSLPQIESPREKLTRAASLHLAGQLEQADQIYQELIPLARTQDDKWVLGTALRRHGLIANSRGEYSKALARAQESVSIFLEIEDSESLARSWNNVGLALHHLGNFKPAVDAYQKALEIDRTDGAVENESIHLNNLANVYFSQRNYQAAGQHYSQALSRIQPFPEQEWYGREFQRTSLNLAVLYDKLGQHQRSLEIYQGLLANKMDLSVTQEALLISNLGALYRHLGDPFKALQAYQEALALFEKPRIQDREDVGADLDRRINILLKIGIVQTLDLKNYDAALEIFETMLEMAKRADDPQNIVFGELYRAELLRRMGRLSEAHSGFEIALEGAAELGASEESWKALLALGRIALENDQLRDAQEQLESAIGVIETVRSRIGLSSLASGFLDNKREVYDLLMRVLLRQLFPDSPIPAPAAAGFQLEATAFQQLLALLERSRARVFQDRLGRSGWDQAGAFSQDREGRLKELQAQLRMNFQRQMDSDQDDQAILKSQMTMLENQYLELERSLSGASKRFNLEEIQAGLDEKTVVFEYWLGPDQMVRFWFTEKEQGLSIHPWGESERKDLQYCLESLRDPGRATWLEPCGGLSKVLLGEDVLDLLEGHEDLIVIPDRMLSFVPFEALPVTSELLISKVSVSYLQTALALQGSTPVNRNRWLPWTPTLLAFGDPVLSGSQNRQWAQLPHSRQEVISVGKALPGSSQALLGEDAQKSLLIEALNVDPAHQFPVIHLATHAEIDSVNSDRSRIIFSPKPDQEEPEALFLGEILNLDFSGVELVVLSACETRIGRVLESEGVQDLGTAFLIQGAHSVISTLWNISDTASVRLMQGFYWALGQGKSRSAALRWAKLRFLESEPNLTHPYYWAGFVLYGEARSPVPLPLSWQLAILSLLGLLMGSGFILWHLGTRSSKSG